MPVPPPRFKQPRPERPSAVEAERVAATALAFLAEDERRLTRFLTETGLVPGDLASSVGERATLAAVLEHLLLDETLLLTFCANNSLSPDRIGSLLSVLSSSSSE